MKITKSELRKLIREAIREELVVDAYLGAVGSDRFDSPGDIVDRHSGLLMRQLKLDDYKERMWVVNAFTTAVDDAIEFAKPSDAVGQPQPGGVSADKVV